MAGERRQEEGDRTLRLTWSQAIEPVTRAFRSIREGSRYTTGSAPHARDAISVRRIYACMVVALSPTILLGVYNIGLQIHQALAEGGEAMESWQTSAMASLGLEMSPDSIMACFVHGALYYVPILLAAYFAGRLAELLFAVIRREQLSPGTWVFAFVFTLMLPPTAPAWQAAVAMVFGIVMGKEVFGGTGRNIVSPVLLSWAFMYITYPATLSGDEVWVPVTPAQASYLNIITEEGHGALADLSWMDAFLGFTPGAVGETSALACFIGAMVLLLAKTVSWRVVLGFFLGSLACAALFLGADPERNALFGTPLYWHAVVGTWAFALAFLVTDPVTGSHTRTGRWVYGILAGFFVILVRVLNTTLLDGTVIALLFMSLFAAFIDYWVVAANVRRRKARYEAA